MNKPITTFEAYEAGTIQPHEARTQLLQQLISLDDQLDPLEATRKILREQLETVTRDIGDRVHTEMGYEVRVIEASNGAAYDQNALTNLVKSLRANGQNETADLIDSCLKVTTRKAYIKVSPFKS